MCLTDESIMNKRSPSLMFAFMVWIFKTDMRFTNPDRFQHACVHAKYAFKCAAFKHIQTLKRSTQDEKFISKYFK